MARNDVGILSTEPSETTTKGENDLGHCVLQLPCPALQTEDSRSNRPIAFYFGAHIILSGTPDSNYFLSFGDQIGSLVFIFALHLQGNALPYSFLCLDAKYFQSWLFHNEGEETSSEEPPSTAWGIHNALDFCEINMADGHELTVHIKEKAILLEKAVIVINHLVKVKKSDNYSFIFKIELASDNDSAGNQSPDGSNEVADDLEDEDCSENQIIEMTKAQKAAITRAKTKAQGKSRHQAKRGKKTLPAGQLDVGFMLQNAQKTAASYNGTVEGAGTGKKTKSKGVKTPAVPPKLPKVPKVLDEPKQPTRQRLQSSTKAMTTTDGSMGLATSQLVSAITAAITKVSSNNTPSSTTTSNVVSATSTFSATTTSLANSKKIQRDDDESDFKLYHMKRMNDLAFFNEMNRVTDPASRGRSQNAEAEAKSFQLAEFPITSQFTPPISRQQAAAAYTTQYLQPPTYGRPLQQQSRDYQSGNQWQQHQFSQTNPSTEEYQQWPRQPNFQQRRQYDSFTAEQDSDQIPNDEEQRTSYFGESFNSQIYNSQRSWQQQQLNSQQTYEQWYRMMQASQQSQSFDHIQRGAGTSQSRSSQFDQGQMYYQQGNRQYHSK